MKNLRPEKGVEVMKKNVFKSKLFGCLFLLFLSVSVSHATIFTVTKTADTNDNVCDADCSLREAIFAANQTANPDIVDFSALFDTPQTIQLTGAIQIEKDVEIQGKGIYLLTIRGSGTQPIFNLNLSGGSIASAVFGDLRLTNGDRAIAAFPGRILVDHCQFDGNSTTDKSGGGAIYVDNGGSLAVYDSTFSSNISQLGGAIGSVVPIIVRSSLFDGNQANFGGAIYSRSISLDKSTFKDNIATADGGAIYVQSQTATISTSTFKGNSGRRGSAFYIDTGTADLSNTTFSENLAPIGQGDTYTVTTANGTMTMTNVTATRNVVRNSGAAVGRFGAGGQISIKNTIVADNIQLPGLVFEQEKLLGLLSYNVFGVTSLGGNLVGFALPNDGFPAGLPNANGDYVGNFGSPLNPQLDPLANNGGETETQAVLAGSPAIDHGLTTGAPVFDQRGAVRPRGMGVDIGAFESGNPFTTVPVPQGSNVYVVSGITTVIFPRVVGAVFSMTFEEAALRSLGRPPGNQVWIPVPGVPPMQITTTAIPGSFRPPIAVCMQVSGISTITDFNNLHIFHEERGVLVDRTFSRDFPTRTICAQTSSLSPFVVLQNVSPTAANVSISGRVLTADGRGLRNAIVTLTEQSGAVRTARSSSFGYYRFNEIAAGQTVILNAAAKQFQFAPQIVAVNDDLAELDLTAVGN
jgi:CSLREA domain-containing protein